MFMILLVDDTTFLLNLIVQSIGYHLHYFLQLGFHTDAVRNLVCPHVCLSVFLSFVFVFSLMDKRSVFPAKFEIRYS